MIKRITAVILSFALLLNTVSQAWILLSFEVNHDFIAEYICVEKDDINNHCQGGCFLKDKLEKDQQEKQDLRDIRWGEFVLYHIPCIPNQQIEPEYVLEAETVFGFLLPNNIRNPHLELLRPPAGSTA